MDETAGPNKLDLGRLSHVYSNFAVAFVRGRCLQGDVVELDAKLLEVPLQGLQMRERIAIYETGRRAGLRLHKFKRTMELARVRRVLGAMRSIDPQTLLDVGSGRGTFLWPLLEACPDLMTTAIDTNPQRASDLQAVRLGGVSNLTAHRMDVTQLRMENESFDVITALEVLEHVPDYSVAISELVRVARRFIIASVPAKPDDNPEHLHLLTRDRLETAFKKAGCRKISFDAVLNHLVVFASLD